MTTLSSEKKVGMTILASLACLMVLVLFVGKVRFGSSGYRVKFLFNFVDSLKTEAPVLYGGGVRIGVVEKIEAVKGLVQVTCLIHTEDKIPKDSEITINTTGILGEKYIQVNSGHVENGALAENEVLQGSDPGSLDRTLQRLEKLSDALEPLLADDKVKGNLAKTLQNAGRLTGELADIVSQSHEDVLQSVKNLRDLTANFDKVSQQAIRVANGAEKLVSEENRKNLEQSLAHVDSTLSKMDNAMTQIENKKGAVGDLIYDDETAENLRTLLRDLKNHPWKLLWKK